MSKISFLGKKLLEAFLITILIIVFSVLLVLFIGRSINRKTPKNGINKGMFVEINGTKQWIQMYGKNLENPVLLYLHGGPGAPTSLYDHAFTKDWTDIYTVVTWDQRNSGKSYSADQSFSDLSYQNFMQDGLEMTQFLCKFFNKEKITLLGHSWGSLFGANLALNYPQYYECYIGTGQVVDMDENEKAFVQAAKSWAQNDPENQKLLEELEKDDSSTSYWLARQKIMQIYKYDMYADGRDYNLVSAIIFNPHYSLSDILKVYDYLVHKTPEYADYTLSPDFKNYTLTDKTEYQIPYYNINGDKDFQANYLLAQKYFDTINAPKKQLFIMKDSTHGLLEARSKEFSKILHQIANQIYK
ncbi:MAG: alpha/beta fold hydrolase [Treponema sp.]|nr:alpha/beta fold hydrolase [Treponema sp.]